MKKYIITEASDLPKINPVFREIDDQIWKKHILSYLSTYFKETDNKIIQKIINEENKKPRAEIETAIKKHIKKWFRKNTKFLNAGFIVNIEVGSEGRREGFYDIKFQHSFWNFTKTYFPFECKNLGKTKSMSLAKSIREYVLVDTESKTDGGMYRYFIDKYSTNQNFGGVIGFVVSETQNSLTKKLVEEIEDIYSTKEIGKLTKEKIIIETINDYNTFDSHHIRKNIKTTKIEEFEINHIIMDFINNSDN